jgi:hypothetical protein
MSNNITAYMDFSETGASSESVQPSTNTSTVRLIDVEVKNENIALNLLVSFLNLAQKRGAFSIDESAKIWECIKIFQKKE